MIISSSSRSTCTISNRPNPASIILGLLEPAPCNDIRPQRRLDRYRIADGLAHASRRRSDLFVHDHDYCSAVLDNDDELSGLSLDVDRLELFIATAWRPPSSGRDARPYELDGQGPLGRSDVVVDGQLAVWAEANVPITATAAYPCTCNRQIRSFEVAPSRTPAGSCRRGVQQWARRTVLWQAVHISSWN